MILYEQNIDLKEAAYMKFKTAKYTVLSLLLAGLAVGVSGVFLVEEGTSLYTYALTITMVLLCAGIVVGAVWARCPHCGKHLFINMLKWKTCPQCGRGLIEEKKR